MSAPDPSRIDCDQPNCKSWIGDAGASVSIRKEAQRDLAEQIALMVGWQRAGSGWFCPDCVRRGKATAHNPDYSGTGFDRLGRPLPTPKPQIAPEMEPIPDSEENPA